MIKKTSLALLALTSLIFASDELKNELNIGKYAVYKIKCRDGFKTDLEISNSELNGPTVAFDSSKVEGYAPGRVYDSIASFEEPITLQSLESKGILATSGLSLSNTVVGSLILLALVEEQLNISGIKFERQAID